MTPSGGVGGSLPFHSVQWDLFKLLGSQPTGCPRGEGPTKGSQNGLWEDCVGCLEWMGMGSKRDQGGLPSGPVAKTPCS